jgi:gamma-glutamyltranspeptidase/glutathione hydrolase
MARSTHRLATATGVAPHEAAAGALDAVVGGAAVRPAGGFARHVPGRVVAVRLFTGARTGTGPGRPALLPGQGIAPAAATLDAVHSLGLDLVPGAGVPAATAPGAGCARLIYLRDHGSQPWNAVLRTASSTPRPVTLSFPG